MATYNCPEHGYYECDTAAATCPQPTHTYVEGEVRERVLREIAACEGAYDIPGFLPMSVLLRDLLAALDKLREERDAALAAISSDGADAVGALVLARAEVERLTREWDEAWAETRRLVRERDALRADNERAWGNATARLGEVHELKAKLAEAEARAKTFEDEVNQLSVKLVAARAPAQG